MRTREHVQIHVAGNTICMKQRKLKQESLKNKFAIGNQLELMLPDGNHQFIFEHMEDKNGNPIAVAPGSGYWVWIKPIADISTDIGLLIADTC